MTEPEALVIISEILALIGENLLLMFLGFFSLGFLGLAFAYKKMALAWVSSIILLGLGASELLRTTTNYDIHWILGVVGLVSALVVFVLGFVIQNEVAEESYKEEMKNWKPELSEEEAYRKKLDDAVNETRAGARSRRRLI